MFIKSFARGGHKMSTADTLALVQALLTYNAPQFLSSDPTDRLMGELFLGTITRVSYFYVLFIITTGRLNVCLTHNRRSPGNLVCSIPKPSSLSRMLCRLAI
jgi:hypothetical protein